MILEKQIQSVLLIGSVFFCACVKNTQPEQSPLQREESLLTISLSGDLATKAGGSGHGNQADDNYIQTLEIFIFHADGNSAGELDAYKKFTAADGVNNLQIKATTGNKQIYAVANSHRKDWIGITTLTQFCQATTSLQKENLKDFTMSGGITATLQTATSVTFAISRLAARIGLSSIKTAFTGTPYEGLKLTNVKVWLLNVHGVKNVHDGETASAVILNDKTLLATDVNACTMPGMLYDAVTLPVGDAGYALPHYFYAYENLLEQESAESRFTRLVIQGDLNGKTYYYPVNINQEGHGYVVSNGHKGVKRNTSYELNVTIFRPGSTDPDKPMEHGTLGVTLNVLNWNRTSAANPEF